MCVVGAVDSGSGMPTEDQELRVWAPAGRGQCCQAGHCAQQGHPPAPLASAWTHLHTPCALWPLPSPGVLGCCEDSASWDAPRLPAAGPRGVLEAP